jgi:N-hydroxyarylamine O-acetyltransferase
VSADTIDLPAYLARIGWAGAPSSGLAPDLALLKRLAAAHAAAIAFEAIDPWLGVRVTIDLPSLQAKLVHGGRGGFCFEHNLLFAAALRTLGFSVSYLSARVLWLQREDAITPRTHMLLRVEIEGQSHIVDVGFGRLTLTGALHLVPDLEQPTPLEPFRLVMVDGEWRLQARLKGVWRSLYRFDLQPQLLVDLAVANHFAATHPRSVFVNDLIAARATSDRRLTLQNRHLAIHHHGGRREQRELRGAAEIRSALAHEFGLTLAPNEELDRRLDRLA